jgi:flagellin-specific chaperone FliS
VGSALVLFLALLLILTPVILLLFLIDKVKKIEDIAQGLINLLNSESRQASTDKLDSSFNNLNGRELWDALCGRAGEGAELPLAEVELMRAKFKPLFEKQLKHLFSSGLQDAKAGKARSLPKNQKTYNTLRGEIAVWLPAQQTSSLYNAGFEYANADADTARRVASNVQESIDYLHSALNMEVSPALRDSLINLPEQTGTQ